MPDKPLKSLLLSQLRRDVVALTGMFVIVLLWLSWVGALSMVQGILAALFTIGVGAVYNISSAVTLKASRTADQSVSRRDARRAAEKARRLVIESFSQPVLLLHKGQIEVSNEPAIRLFNLPAGRSGLSVASLRHPELLAAVERVIETRELTTCEFNPARNPGDAWLAEIVTIDVNKRNPRILVTMFDQRSVRLAESARADFLANASHELRTPLTAISGFIETMKGPARKDMAAWPRFIDIMDEQVTHMRALVADLLSLSRIELSEHMPPETQADLRLAVLEAVEALDHLAKAQNVRIVRPSDSGAMPVIADPSELKQVIGNLVGNALKYSPEGSEITLEIDQTVSLSEAQIAASRRWAGAGRVTLLGNDASSAKGVWLRVTDQGPGIEEKFLPRLGERFFRVDDSRGGPIEGTGLGLAIVKHIMSRHQGGLAVESVPGQGAAFSVWFPAPE